MESEIKAIISNRKPPTPTQSARNVHGGISVRANLNIGQLTPQPRLTANNRVKPIKEALRVNISPN